MRASYGDGARSGVFVAHGGAEFRSRPSAAGSHAVEVNPATTGAGARRDGGSISIKLDGGPPAEVTPICVNWKPEAQASKAQPRVYPLEKRRQLSQHMTKMGKAKKVYSTPQVMYASVTVAMRKGVYFRLVANYRLVYSQVEAVPWPYPNLEQAAKYFEGVSYVASSGRSECVMSNNIAGGG